jgi:predicted acetyltransferase
MTVQPISLRLARDKDLAQIVNLDRLSFAPLRTDTDIQREWYGDGLNLPERQLFLAEESSTGKGIGTYTQLDLALFLAGVKIPTLGIAGVAVAPHRRGMQVARLMLEHAVKEGRSRQIPLSMLYPFQHGFYRKLGWAWVGRTFQYRVAAQHLPLYPKRVNIQPYDATAHSAVLQQLYEKAAIVHNGWLQRQPWQWEHYLKSKVGREIYCYVAEGELQGYIILRFVELPNGLGAIVQEWVAPTSAAYQGLLGFLGTLWDQFHTIVWNTDALDPFPHLLKEQRRDPTLPTSDFEFGLTHRFGEIGGGFMWRLVDVVAALENRAIATIPTFAVTFQIDDPILGKQQINAEFAEGQIRCHSIANPTTITLSIEKMTELFCGFRRSRDLLWTGELDLTGPDCLTLLDQALETPAPFCWDFF